MFWDLSRKRPPQWVDPTSSTYYWIYESYWLGQSRCHCSSYASNEMDAIVRMLEEV